MPSEYKRENPLNEMSKERSKRRQYKDEERRY